MTTRAQAIEAAHRWINGELPSASADGSTGARRVHSHEFDLGWVLWAEPSPVRVDPLTGERRAPEEVGAACAVVDRATGRFTVWPSVPVDEVVTLYRDFLGAGAHDPGLPPATGRGTRAELTYRDALGEPRSLALRSAPGLPHPALRGWWWLREQGVRAEDVLAVHTDLRLSALPGGYWAHALAAELPGVRVGFDLPYGPRFDHRAAAVRALPADPDGPARNRVPFPRGAAPGPARPDGAPSGEVRSGGEPTPGEPTDRALADRLVERFGAGGVRRFDPADLARADLPEATARVLRDIGVPVAVEGFFGLHHPGPDAIADGTRAGSVLPPLAAHLAEAGRGTRVAERERLALAPQLLLGTDGWALITVDTACGAVRAVDPDYATARHCNDGAASFVRCLALFDERLPGLRGLDPRAAGAAVDALQRELAAIDPTVFDDPENWWAVIVEQLWDGLL
ncbi:SUKH-4 family immunity protein [Kitasatospora sp. CM 4170]|uniref:SUKH-4 family immunity protein n=1 Tax=Kitasatospora aburaviensis TaxID=67265 RepID=A0ABW1EXY2_9ACTN|nr:SUKH-4 family immunity protein [Kitasatospora sp. CM 4170]WNM46424.1 SUKH-4 family immunity protein [Kitasatospora sp. CM 4170]